MCDAFDTRNNDNSAVHRREATRLVSCSQPGSGSWLARVPDHTLAHSKVPSPYYLVQLQQRLGLYISSLAPYLSATASQHERLGDAALNDMNESARHNSALRCLFNALNALTMPNQPPHALRLCDRGDGTPAGKATARQTYAHINSGHVPDMIRHGAPPEAHEFKCVTPHVQGPLRGQGTVQHGGCPSQADGGDYAFGATEENLIKKNIGLRERGKPSDGPFDRKIHRQARQRERRARTTRLRGRAEEGPSRLPLHHRELWRHGRPALCHHAPPPQVRHHPWRRR